MHFSQSFVLSAAALLLSTAFGFEGDGTFYGAGGDGPHGDCMLQRGFNGVPITAAMNRAQLEGGYRCGACVKVMGEGTGIGMTPIVGPIYATIDNECSECHYGDVDLGLGGDGRWRITWEWVSCDEARAAQSNMPVVVPPTRRTLRDALHAEFVEKSKTFIPGYVVTPEGLRSPQEYEAMQKAMEAAREGGN